MDDDEWNAQHIGRSWAGTPLEDHCPCVKEPCGLVRVSDMNPACEHHPPERAKTIRQSHPASECPASPPGDAAGRAEYERARTDRGAPHWRDLTEADRETWRLYARHLDGTEFEAPT